MKQHLISFLKFLFFLSIGLGILYWVYQNQQANYQAQCVIDHIPMEDCDLADKLAADFSQVKPFWIAMVVLCFMLSNIIRAFRWSMLIEPLGKKVRSSNTFMALMLGYLINYIVPRAGEVAKCAAINRYEKVAVEQLVGTIVVSRSLDVICFGIFIALAFLLNFDILWGYLNASVFQGTHEPLWMSYWLWAAVTLICLALVIGWIKREGLKQTIIFQKIWSILLGLWKGVKTISQLRRPGLFWLNTALIWILYYLMHYLAFFAFEPTAHLTPADGLTLFVFGSLGIIIPSPGGLGSYQYLVTLALSEFYAIAPVDAFSFSMIVFFPPFICNILFGFLSLILLPAVNRMRE